MSFANVLKIWCALSVFLIGLSAAPSDYPDVSLNQLLSNEQQQRIGTKLLTSDQREALRRALIDVYVAGFNKGKQEASKNISKALATSSVETANTIESQVDGNFEGWDGNTVVKLTNGQIWKQAEYYYEYHYAFMPDVLVYKSGSGYKMKVDGTDEAVGVEPAEVNRMTGEY